MDKVDTKTITTEIKVHKFYCDECDKFIDSVEEYDDYYPIPSNVYSLRNICYSGLYIFDTRFKPKEKYFCKECFERKKQEFINTIKNSGLFDVE